MGKDKDTDQNKKRSSKRKLDKLKKDAQAKYQSGSSMPPFDATDPRDIYFEVPPEVSSLRRTYVAHMEDNYMRSVLWQVLEMEGMADCTNEQLCKWLRKNNIWTDTQAAVFVMDYLAAHTEGDKDVE